MQNAGHRTGISAHGQRKTQGDRLRYKQIFRQSVQTVCLFLSPLHTVKQRETRKHPETNTATGDRRIPDINQAVSGRGNIQTICHWY